MTQALTIDDAKVQRMLRGVDLAAYNPDAAWAEGAQYMRVRTDSMFRHLRRGGTHRGVTWKDWTPQYTRKDGTVVPAWGGIPKVRGRGMVKGRKRPSGKRVTQSSALMQDTMTMRGRAALVVRRNRNMLQLGPQGVNYAHDQNKRRQFLFFEIPPDAKEFGRIFARHIATGAKTGRLPTLAAGLRVGNG